MCDAFFISETGVGRGDHPLSGIEPIQNFNEITVAATHAHRALQFLSVMHDGNVAASQHRIQLIVANFFQIAFIITHIHSERGFKRTACFEWFQTIMTSVRGVCKDYG